MASPEKTPYMCFRRDDDHARAISRRVSVAVLPMGLLQGRVASLSSPTDGAGPVDSVPAWVAFIFLGVLALGILLAGILPQVL